MDLYRTLWCRVVCAVAVVGVVNAVLVLPSKDVVGVVVSAAIVGPAVGALAHARTSATMFPSPSSLLQAGALATVGAVAVVGLLALAGGTALIGLGLLAVGSPAVLRRLPVRPPRAGRHQPHVGAAAHHPPRAAPPSCHSLSATELCWRWRTSSAALRHTVSPAQRLYLIQTRAALLDELAHRDPEQFARWLHSNTHHVDDPARFLAPTLEGHHTRSHGER